MSLQPNGSLIPDLSDNVGSPISKGNKEGKEGEGVYMRYRRKIDLIARTYER